MYCRFYTERYSKSYFMYTTTQWRSMRSQRPGVNKMLPSPPELHLKCSTVRFVTYYPLNDNNKELISTLHKQK